MDPHKVLKSLAAISIETWNFENEDPSVRHIGPMAQDFYAAFGLGGSPRTISMVDADGVNLAAVQALYDLLQEKDTRIAELEARLTALEKALVAGTEQNVTTGGAR